jgi:YHS domain-containing protein
MKKCKYCKNELKNPKRSFCNQKCWHSYYSKYYSGKNNPCFGIKKNGEYKKCSNCGKKIWVVNNRLRRLNNYFCNRKCWRKSEKESIKVLCKFCGKEKITYPYDKNIKRNHFCSQKCKAKWQSENLNGKNNNNFNNYWNNQQKKSLGEKQKIRLREHPEKHPNRILAKNGHISTPQKQLFKLIKYYYPSAELNHRVITKNGFGQRHADVGLPEFKLDIEFDGDYWHNPEDDRERDQELLEVGWKTIRFGYKDLKTPEMIIKKIKEWLS